ncbi:MAG TPA: DUF1732 domain-containing protein [Planctomycetota bacterium]|nr:DUF1732 domain-containing protein [Planctomycetota bacterium]
MQSMTGFGSGSVATGEGTATVQIASVNNRGCQISLKSELRNLELEEEVRRRVRETLVRGSITVHVSYVSAQALMMDTERLLQAWRELAELARSVGAPTPALETVAELQHFGRAHGDAGARATILGAVDQAVAGVVAARGREGTALAQAFRAHARDLGMVCVKMRAAAQGRVARHRESLTLRLREVLNGPHAVGEDVLVRELALYADRIDVTEELVRLQAHDDALARLIDGPVAASDAVGRKLEFLLQEIGREVNTVGSKSNDTALTALVLEAKSICEQMREQAANVA